MDIFELLLIFFLISLTKALQDGLTYRSWTNRDIIWGRLKHIAGVALILVAAISFSIYGHYYHIIGDYKQTIILFLAFACLNFVWFNFMYRIISGEKQLIGDTDPIDLLIAALYSGFILLYTKITKKDPEFPIWGILVFIKLCVFSLGLYLLDKYIAI